MEAGAVRQWGHLKAILANFGRADFDLKVERDGQDNPTQLMKKLETTWIQTWHLCQLL